MAGSATGKLTVLLQVLLQPLPVYLGMWGKQPPRNMLQFASSLCINAISEQYQLASHPTGAHGMNLAALATLVLLFGMHSCLCPGGQP